MQWVGVGERLVARRREGGVHQHRQPPPPRARPKPLQANVLARGRSPFRSRITPPMWPSGWAESRPPPLDNNKARKPTYAPKTNSTTTTTTKATPAPKETATPKEAPAPKEPHDPIVGRVVHLPYGGGGGRWAVSAVSVNGRVLLCGWNTPGAPPSTQWPAPSTSRPLRRRTPTANKECNTQHTA